MTTEILQRVRESSRLPTIDVDDVRGDEERVNMASVDSSMLFETMNLSGTPFKFIGTCIDGAFIVHQEDKSWRIEKRVAEDLAMGRLSLAEMFSKSKQMANPCKPDTSTDLIQK